MESLFIIAAVLAFALSSILAAFGIWVVLPGVIEDDMHMLETIEDMDALEFVRELWLLTWDSREFLYPSGFFFALGVALMLVSHTV